MDRKISIIVPAYNEEASLDELYERLIASFNTMKEKGQVSSYEIWFINDGSKDNTEGKIEELISKDKNVHLISFRKNFGKSPALDAGFHHVTGDLVFTLDADLQDEPSEMTRFVEKIDEGYDLVVGWKFNRLDPMEKKLPSKLFNYVTRKLSGVSLHDFDCGFKCFRKEVIKALDVYGEFHRYIPVLAYRKGFKITEITVDHKKIYEAGDTCLRLDRVEAYKKKGPFDVLIAPINGAYGNMNEQECARLSNALNPKITIPCHYGMFASHGGDPGKFYQIMTEQYPEQKFLLMAQGERYAF